MDCKRIRDCRITVDNSITEEDALYIDKFLVKVQPIPEKAAFKDQIEFVKAVQRQVLYLVPNKSPLPYFKPREPKDIHKARGKYGACCDRSRLLEKILRRYGFKTRHVFMWSKKTHAVSEVLTKKGWLVIDSNSYWVSLDRKNSPYSMKYIRCGSQILWEKPMCSQNGRSDMKDLCEGSFTFLYGVYSRSGKLYPPFIYKWPNINLREFIIDNLKLLWCYLRDQCQRLNRVNNK